MANLLPPPLLLLGEASPPSSNKDGFRYDDEVDDEDEVAVGAKVNLRGASNFLLWSVSLSAAAS